VDAEREAAGGAVSGMKTICGPVQAAAAMIDQTDKPINFIVSSTLNSLEKFNSVVREIAMVGKHAMHLVQSCIDSSNLQIHPYAHAAWTVLSIVAQVRISYLFLMIKN